MAVSTGLAMAVSTAVSIAGQLQQGRAQRKAAEAEAAQMEKIAAQQQDVALQEAERIRSQADKVRGAARAQMAANGIDVNSGTALTIEEEIETESEKDAFNVLLTGKRQAESSRFSASQARARGKGAVTSSMLGSISTGIEGWKGVKKAGGI